VELRDGLDFEQAGSGPAARAGLGVERRFDAGAQAAVAFAMKDQFTIA
jgi:hypothetical protein